MCKSACIKVASLPQVITSDAFNTTNLQKDFLHVLVSAMCPESAIDENMSSSVDQENANDEEEKVEMEGKHDIDEIETVVETRQ